MQTGRQTLGSIDQGLRQIHDHVQEIDQRVKDSSSALMDIQREQSDRFKRMAEIRLDNVISGELREGLDAADQRARELIRQRGQKLGLVNRKIKSNREQQAQLEDERVAANEALARAIQTLDKAEAASQAALEADPHYMAQLETTRNSQRTADHAKDKTRQSESTREEKGAPYEADPLFMYLWQRQYGTSGYRAGALARFLDDWVADLCEYNKARPNYATLLEIPKRLGEHAQRLRDNADEEFISLTRMEVLEADKAGIPALREAADQAQAAVDTIDIKIEESENELHTLESARNKFASGEDADFKQAIDTMRSAFERESLLTLYEYARATVTTEDDILVKEMEGALEHLRQAQETLADRKRMRERQSERLKELEGVRRRFKRSRFDNPHSEFRNDALLGMALSQFLSGTVTASELWRTIERGQHYRRIQANPGFGTGGFRPRAGTWHTPFPGGGGLGGGLGRRRGGGLRPGGGGGGGFRTGGGF